MPLHLTLLSKILIGRVQPQAAPMGQMRAPALPKNEVGFTLCRTKSGQLTRGPMAMGTPRAVSIPISCPVGSRFIGLWHTHPGGSVTPSRVDKNSAIRFDAEFMCITNDTKTKCARITGRR